MPLNRNAFAGADERYDRFEWLYREIGLLTDIINEITTTYRDTHLKLSAGDGKEVSLIFATSVGKAMKTFHAISLVAVLGYGEDAAILIRSNIDLLINLAYFLAAPDTASRIEIARDFRAYSYSQHEKHMRLGFGEAPQIKAPFPDPELTQRIKRWKGTQISDRATAAEKATILSKEEYYDKRYRFYSSFEHSDANALARYLERWDDEGPFISADPDDEMVELVLADNFGIMAQIADLMCKYFRIDRPDLRRQVREASGRIAVYAARKSTEQEGGR